MTFVSSWKAPAGKATYVSTGKDMPVGGGDEELAYWMLAGRMDSAFGGTPATVAEIYYQVARPMGLSSSEAGQLVRGAKRSGYLG